MKIHVSPFLFLFCLFFSINLMIGQVAEVGIEIKEAKATVLEFAAPYSGMKVDLVDDDESTITFVHLQTSTQILSGKKEVPPSAIGRGMEINLTGELFKDGIQVTEIKLLTKYDNWKVKVDGVFEKLVDGVAFIDGLQVVMGEEGELKGKGIWKKKTFKSFAELPLGCFIKVNGIRKSDRLIYLEDGKGTAEPNELTKLDQEFRTALSSNLSYIDQPDAISLTLDAFQQQYPSLSPQHLSHGQVQVGGQSFELVRDYNIVAYVNQIGQSLIPAYIKEKPVGSEGHISFRFYVINDPTFNAFAYPDGSIFVHSGLLRLLENEAQLATVLGHEIAHVTHEHGAKNYRQSTQKAKTLNVITKLKNTADNITGNKTNVPGLGGIGADVALGLTLGALSSNYGRQHEDQADRVGLFYMREAGYDPRQAPQVWRRLMHVNQGNKVKGWINDLAESAGNAMTETNIRTAVGQNPDDALAQAATNALGNLLTKKGMEMLYRSHPGNRKRYKNLNRQIATSPENQDFTQMQVGLDSYKQAVGNL